MGIRGRSVGVRAAITLLVVALATPAFPALPAAAQDRAPLAKVSPALLAAATAGPSRRFSVIVSATAKETDRDKDEHVARAATAVREESGEVEHALGVVGGVSGTVSGSALLALARDHGVAEIVEDRTFRASFDPTDAAAAENSPGLVLVGAPKAWTTYGATGLGVGVAVVDSGVAAHPDLGTRIVAAIDFTSATPTVSTVPLGDPGGHGTHIAGLIAGDGTASDGYYTGVAPQARIVDVRVIGADGTTTLSTVLRGLQWVLANHATYGIRVVNLSLGALETTSYTQDLLVTATEFLTFARLVVVIAAGNAGPTASTIATPAVDPWSITVGAVDETLSPVTVATFSSVGPTPVNAIAKPDLVAPGRRMISLLAPGSTLDTLYPTREVAAPGAVTPRYFMLSGTSTAAPLVAGAAALLLQKYPTLTPAQVKHRLLATATPMAPSDPNVSGAGMLNIPGALASTDLGAYVTTYRVTDAFAQQAYKLLYGTPLSWLNPTFNGIDWTQVNWSNITWNEITWENISWQEITWESITWESITWESITWETATSLSAGALSGNGGGWALVN